MPLPAFLFSLTSEQRKGCIFFSWFLQTERSSSLLRKVNTKSLFSYFSIFIDEITNSFRRYGHLVVDWPHKAESKSYFPPKGNSMFPELACLFHPPRPDDIKPTPTNITSGARPSRSLAQNRVTRSSRLHAGRGQKEPGSPSYPHAVTLSGRSRTLRKKSFLFFSFNVNMQLRSVRLRSEKKLHPLAPPHHHSLQIMDVWVCVSAVSHSERY